jgi:hypothetical protein
LNDLTIDAGYIFPPFNKSKDALITNNNYYYYSGLLYDDIYFKNVLKNFTIYKGIFLEYDNSPKKKVKKLKYLKNILQTNFFY